MELKNAFVTVTERNKILTSKPKPKCLYNLKLFDQSAALPFTALVLWYGLLLWTQITLLLVLHPKYLHKSHHPGKKLLLCFNIKLQINTTNWVSSSRINCQSAQMTWGLSIQVGRHRNPSGCVQPTLILKQIWGCEALKLKFDNNNNGLTFLALRQLLFCQTWNGHFSTWLALVFYLVNNWQLNAGFFAHFIKW